MQPIHASTFARRIVLRSFLALFAVAFSAPASSWAYDCPVKVNTGGTADEWSYRMRGSRCEGLFSQQVATTAELALGSLVAGISGDEPSPSSEWTVSWSKATPNTIKLQARSLLYRQYYRMDATVAGGSRSFKWSTDVLAGIPVKRKNIGVLVSTEETILGRKESVFIPAFVGPAASGAANVVAEVIPTRDLSELYMKVMGVDKSSGKLVELVPQRALNYGFYPGNRSIRIPISISGIQQRAVLIQLVGPQKSGGTLSTSFWIANGS